MIHIEVTNILNALEWDMRRHGVLSELGQDLLDTIKELVKSPFDFSSANKQIKNNDAKYTDVFMTISAMPTTVKKRHYDITEDDLKYILNNQVKLLYAKYIENIKS